MRFRNPSVAGKSGARTRAIQRAGRVIGPRPPAQGTKLKTLRVTDHVLGQSYTLTIHQGRRLNNIEPRIFGHCIFVSKSVGLDEFFRLLRRRWKPKWIVEQ